MKEKEQIRTYKFALVLALLAFILITVMRETVVKRSVQDLNHTVQEQNSKIDSLNIMVQDALMPKFAYEGGGTGTLPYDFETRKRGVRVYSNHESR